MNPTRNRDADYQTLINTLKRQRKGVTAADMAARTGMPLHTVRELVPMAADEYSARLEVTESGEILYSFPRGFTSKYRGFRAGLRRAGQALKRGLKIGGTAVFKVWIMVMLVGYFLIFMLLALASLMLTMFGGSSSNGRSSGRGGLNLSSGIFNMIIRIWFYSELMKPR
ncbi:MAG: hypothetical protein LBT11_01165, partial [Treponema sp.]|nr:hypothetical protein [Treponema sp.]